MSNFIDTSDFLCLEGH